MAGGGGQGSPLARALGQINQAKQLGNPGSPGFVAPSQLGQQASYKPGFSGPSNINPMPTMSNDLVRPVAPQVPQMSPFAQQMMQRSMAPQPIMGLPAALMQMQGRLNQPMMRGPMPTYQNPALNYRPDMTLAQQRLNSVAKSVILQQKEAAEAELKQMRAAEEARRMQEQNTHQGYAG